MISKFNNARDFKNRKLASMEKPLVIFMTIICFTVTGALAQSDAGSRANFMIQTGMTVTDSDFRQKEITLDASAIERDARLINLRYDEDAGIIRLDDTKLIEDDGPATGVPEGYKSYTPDKASEWVEDLKKGIVIKKIFEVDNPSAVSGRVVFKGMEVKDNGEPLYLSLNGEQFIRPATKTAYPHARQYIDLSWDRWYYIDLPVEKLRRGENELLMWTESKSTSWRVLIALNQEFKRGSLTRTPPNRSMKSRDGGKTWSDTQLGPMNSVDGEYSVRLSLDQFLTSGEYISDLIDVVDGVDPIKRKIDNLKVSMWPELETPGHTTAEAFVRFGANPLTVDVSWTEWEPVEKGKTYSLSDKRYLQWKVNLGTNDPLVTPRIRGLRMTAVWEDHSPNRGTGLFARVVNNGKIVPMSYPFSYENLNHPELKKYREDHRLDQIVAGATSEFDTMMRLLNWAYRVPLTLDRYSWNWNDVAVVEHTTGSAMPKLNGPFFKGRRMVGMCLYPNQGLIGALLSMGFQARHINIHSEGMSGHEVTEVWSNEFNKWIYMDATRDYYYFDQKTGVPLNLLEIHKLLVAVTPRVENWKRPFAPEIGKEVVSRINVGMRQGDNPFSIKNDGYHIMEIMGHFRIIPRNDFLSHPLPVPVHTGETMWGWDGFLNWYDDTFPKRDEYQRYSDRATDFYPLLNQAKIFLNETSKPGILNVVAEEFTPGGFDGFLVKVNDEDWRTENKYNWNLSLISGINTIRVRTKNVRGILGPISEIVINYNP